MDHEEAVEKALAMMKAAPAYIEDSRVGSRVGNSVIGSLLSIQYGMPRQYSEAAVRDAVRQLDKKKGR